MNIHFAQSYDAEAELRYISLTQENIITAQESKPVITITQDSLIAAYLMTVKDFPLTRSEFMNLTLKGERPDGTPLWNPRRIKDIQSILKKNGKSTKIYNGRGLISLILPESFFYEKKNGTHPTEPVVKIERGVFLEGAFDKSILGADHGSIIQLLVKEYGTKLTSNFIDNMQFLGNNWLMIHGFSVGLEDCMITSEESVRSIKQTLAQCYAKAEGIEETTQNPGIREVRVTAAMSQAKDIGMRIAKNAMSKDNNFLTTVGSGAKGDYFNIAQLTGLLGQQNLEGKRVTPMLNHGRRSLPHYPFGKMSKEREYESRGFIKNSFIHGLTPQEFFFHAMSGREGVCDTAMSTAKSGYIQRKIVKVCEDIQVTYDNTVRDTSGKIYEFAYGENGYDATKTVPVEGEPQICDVSRLVQRINAIEEGIIEDDLKKEDDEVDIVMSEVPTQNPEVFLLVGKILEMFPYSLVSEEWSVEELKQRLAGLQNDEEKHEKKHSVDDEDEVFSEEDEDTKDLVVEEDEEEDEENPEKDENEEDLESDGEYDVSDDNGEEVGVETYYGGDD